MSRQRALKHIQQAHRIVIKIGTSLITGSEGGVDRSMIEKLRNEILYLKQKDIQVILVSSGAVGMGRELLKRRESYEPLVNPGLARRQALASIGQGQLISLYNEIFSESGLMASQILITARDFRDRRAYLNIGRTLNELIALDVVPVINENDTVSTEELRFGDNDLLSAATASLFRADVLVILTSVEGFLKDGLRVDFLAEVKSEDRRHAGGPAGPGSGGMETKLRAGHLGILSGEALAILPGSHERPVQALFEGDDIGTIIFGRNQKRLSARKKWLLYARTEGKLQIDDGARKALIERGSSLLPAGIKEQAGHFLAGDVIDICDEKGDYIARGISNYSYKELAPMLGLNGSEMKKRGFLLRAEEVVHRNNMILEIVS